MMHQSNFAGQSVIRFGNLPSQSTSQSVNIAHGSRIQNSPSTVFIGDLPKGLGLVELYETVKGLVGGADFELVMKKPTGKYFYYAFCRFNDIFAGKILNF
jgi:hypothetical protein